MLNLTIVRHKVFFSIIQHRPASPNTSILPQTERKQQAITNMTRLTTLFEIKINPLEQWHYWIKDTFPTSLPSSDKPATKLYIQKLSDHAIPPVKSTDRASGVDLYSAESCHIKPGEIKLVKIDIAIIYLDGTCDRITPRSGLTVKQYLDIRAGVINSDYSDNILLSLCITSEQRSIDWMKAPK